MTNRHLRSTLTGTALWTIAAGLALPATAQTQPSNTATAQIGTPAPGSGEQPADQSDLVVTGTRIVRDGFQAPTPLTVLSQEEILNQSPTNNIADFVNQIPAFASSLRPANSRLNLSSGNAGINALNLRNLGAQRTLLLLDGRRSPPSTATGFTDVNTIPQTLVKSVEVVTGGASAAYGSDAVAGVVNFVLDKKYTGLKVAADSGITGEGDGFNYSMSVAGGTSFAGGRGHILLSGELARREGIFQTLRDWNQLGYRTIDNPAFAVGNGQPRQLVRFQGGTANATPGGIIISQTGGGTGLTGLYFGSGGAVNRFQRGPINTTALTIGGDWQIADNSRNIGFDADDKREGVFGRVGYEVADWIEVFAEGAYNRSRTFFSAGPQFTTSGAAVTLRNDNAFLINALGRPALTGVTSVVIGTTAVDLPFRKIDNDRELQRYTLGAEGGFQAFGRKAAWNAYAQYGQADVREQLRDIQNTSRVALAADAVFAPAGNAIGVPAGTIVCRSTLTNPGNGCQPLNRLGIGVTSQAAIDYVLGDPYRDQKIKQTVVGANLSVSPFATWGGDVSIAVGGEYRKEELSGAVPTEFRSGWQVGNFLPSFGSFDVKEAFLETVVPLGWGAEFNGAVRATDYSSAGYVTTWKAGLTWQPIEDIRFRVTRSRDIRAPNLNDLFAAGTSRTTTIDDPRVIDPRTGQPGLTRTVLEQTTGNLALRPERATQTNVGVVFQPRFLPGFSASVDAYRLEITDAIGSFLSQAIVNRCFEGRQDFCNAIQETPTGDRELFITAAPFNFNSQFLRGIDYELTYRLPLAGEDDSLTLRALASNYIDNVTVTGVSPPANAAGVNNASAGGVPSWIYRGSVTWDTSDFSITAVGRGVSSGRYANFRVECTASCPTYNPALPLGPSNPLTVETNRLAGTFYADLNFTSKVRFEGAEAEFFVNVTNVFDRWPMLLPEGGLSAEATYSDLLGRTFRIGIRMQTR